ncbi:MAG: hypothetical protein GWM98_13165 [Nitrospinaceae bacterium]|nr:hypothetical protein [Nitrospinaceae bacterium]NIU96901.1 hypothetical protein [Nitrospinaceae bacterium]NIX34891.1 hypothetical protein [Nitrospinaceae bacterium]NIY15768.1 hypothetical protein [Nitrospinaceae bacterium]
MRWTAGLVALLFLFFGASIGFIGTAHQTAWMITSDKPLLKSSWGYKARAYQSDAKSSLRNIYLACKAYWADHGSDRSCNLNIAQTTTYSYIQSRDVVITAGGSEKEFHGIAGHLRDNGWFMINPKGEIEEIKESDSGS